MHDMTSEEKSIVISKTCKVLSHPVRVKILIFLNRSEHCVKEIRVHLGESQAVTSQHIRILLKSGLVKYRREGTSLYYSVCDINIVKNLKIMYNCFEKYSKKPLIIPI